MSDLTATLPAQMLAPVSQLERDMAKTKQQIESATKEEEAATGAKDDALKKTTDLQGRQQEETKEFSIDHPFPHPDIKPWTGVAPKNDPITSFGSWASAFGIIAGAITKTGLASSLNASAAAMNAFRANDMQAYDEAKKSWKENTEASIKNAEWESKGYEAAFELMETDHAAGLAMMQTVAAQADNQVVMAKLKEGNLKDIFDMQSSLVKFAADGPKRMEDMLKISQGMEDYKERSDLYAKWKEQNQQATPEQVAQKKTEIMNPQYTINQAKTLAENAGGVDVLEPATVKLLWDRFNATGQLPAMGYGKAAAHYRKQVYDYGAQQALLTNDTAAQQVARQFNIKAEASAMRKQVESKRAIEAFENTALQNGKVLLDLVDKVDSTGVPVLERWIRGGKQAIQGDVDVTKFNTQLGVFVPEVAKILSNPNLSGQLTDAARSEAQTLVGKNFTADQIKSIIPLLEADFGRRRKAIDDEINASRDNIVALASGRLGPPQDTTSSGHPPVPAGVPDTAFYSASENKFYWEENGETKSKAPDAAKAP